MFEILYLRCLEDRLRVIVDAIRDSLHCESRLRYDVKDHLYFLFKPQKHFSVRMSEQINAFKRHALLFNRDDIFS